MIQEIALPLATAAAGTLGGMMLGMQIRKDMETKSIQRTLEEMNAYFEKVARESSKDSRTTDLFTFGVSNDAPSEEPEALLVQMENEYFLVGNDKNLKEAVKETAYEVSDDTRIQSINYSKIAEFFEDNGIPVEVQ